MKTFPPALFCIADDPTRLKPGCGALLRADAPRDKGLAGGLIVLGADLGVEDLRPHLAAGGAGIALTGWRAGADIQRAAVLLSVAEAEEGLVVGSTPILAITDGILPAPVSPQGLCGKSSRLAALIWDCGSLMQALGAKRAFIENGEWTGAFAATRAAVLLAAAAAGIPAYDSVSDLAGAAFTEDCERSRNDGFFGRLARNPAQAAIIQAVYARAPLTPPSAAS